MLLALQEVALALALVAVGCQAQSFLAKGTPLCWVLVFARNGSLAVRVLLASSSHLVRCGLLVTAAIEGEGLLELAHFGSLNFRFEQ